MSSFVIDKKEYIKAAGIVAGIAKAADLWLYDYETCRNSTPDDYYRKFENCFEMNSISVAEQYHDNNIYTDSNIYRTEFMRAEKKGRELYYFGGDKLKQMIMELRQFFHGCIYQTEKPEYMFNMQMYFNKISDMLMPLLYKCECKSWGTIEI